MPRVLTPPSLTRRRARPGALLLSLVVLALVLAGCGVAGERSTGPATVQVTRDFGTKVIGPVRSIHVRGSDTLLSVIRRSYPVTLSGKTVVSVDGVSAPPGSRWFLFVDGSAIGLGTSRFPTHVHPGDRIWFDLHTTDATASVPAVVGSFPEPFTGGIAGRRVPAVLECAPDVQTACNRVADALAAVGQAAPRQLLGTGSGTDSIAVVVGTWRDVQGEIAALLVEHGPSTGGVYARFAGTKSGVLELLDASGQPVRSLGAGTGLVATTGNNSTVPTWFITGTDVAGVNAAAAAMTAQRLDGHMAIAVQDGHDYPLPQP